MKPHKTSKPLAPEPPTVLESAHAIIYGEREETYGDPAKNLRVIAEYWSTHISATYGIRVYLTTSDVCSMMVLLKQARLTNDPAHRDSEVDVCGYTALRERCRSSGSGSGSGSTL